MKSNALVITAISLATLTSSVWSLPANAAPDAVPTETLVKTVLAKVDSDNKSDTVKLFSLGANVYKLLLGAGFSDPTTMDRSR